MWYISMQRRVIVMKLMVAVWSGVVLGIFLAGVILGMANDMGNE